MTDLHALLDRAATLETDRVLDDVTGDVRRGRLALGRRRRVRAAAGLGGAAAVAALAYAVAPTVSRSPQQVPPVLVDTGAPATQPQEGTPPVSGVMLLPTDGSAGPLDNSRRVVHAGRTYWVTDLGDETRIAFRSHQKPSQWLAIRYPKSSGWTQAQVIDYLAAGYGFLGTPPASGR
jgi:hypothetical protein